MFVYSVHGIQYTSIDKNDQVPILGFIPLLYCTENKCVQGLPSNGHYSVLSNFASFFLRWLSMNVRTFSTNILNILLFIAHIGQSAIVSIGKAMTVYAFILCVC